MYQDSEQLVRLESISKSFKNIRALNEVSFGIKKGEIFGYIGPNGAGKTTTIKIMIGLIRDFEGSVYFKDLSVSKNRDKIHKMLGYLPQQASFQEWRTVDHALTTFGRLSGLSKNEAEIRIKEVLEIIGISKERNRKIAQLSGGTIQKVGIAQAIIHNPEFLVLDEPMSGLDPASRYQFKNIFKELSKNGTTIFFSSHILSDVQDIAGRMGILSQGKILHVGSLEELKSKMSLTKDIDVMLSYDSGRWRDIEEVQEIASIDHYPPNRIIIHLRSDADIDKTIDSIMRKLLESGCRLRYIYPMSPSLEELYVRYVGGVVGS